MISLGSWFGLPTGPRDWWRVLPGDAMGLLIMRFIGLERPTRVHQAGDILAYLIEDERVGRFFKINLIPTRAQTFGRFVFATYELDPETLAHECEHIRQWAKLGPAYLPSYFAASGLEFLAGRRPYWDNAFETAARDRAAQEIAANVPNGADPAPTGPAVPRDNQPG